MTGTNRITIARHARRSTTWIRVSRSPGASATRSPSRRSSTSRSSASSTGAWTSSPSSDSDAAVVDPANMIRLAHGDVGA